MKKTLSMLLACLLSCVLAFSLVACKNAGLTLSDETLALTVGDTKQLTLKEGETDVSKDAEWKSSDEKVVTVTSRGMVSARGAGSATVTGSYNGASAACSVTVKEKEVVVVKITDESGKEIENLTVERDKSVTVKATTSNDSDVTWSSGDTSSVTVTPVDGQKNTATVKGLFPTSSPVTVYATSGSAQSKLAVTVTASSEQTDKGWYDMANKDESGQMIDNGSLGQNRTPVNRWSYWCDMSIWEGGTVEITHAEYLGDSDSSQAGSIHFQYEVVDAGRKPDSCLQITYRTPKTTKATASSEPVNNPKGLLENGKYYKLACTIETDAAGTVVINGNTVELVKGTNNVVVYFLHSDDGAIHSPENGYGTTENQDYGPIQWTAFFLTTGEGLPKAELTISDLQWTESTPPAALNAPSVTVANGKVTVNDTANPEGVKNYTIGFFKNASDTTPAQVVTGNKGENSIDTSRWTNGEYYVKAKANPADGRFLESAWSAAAEGTITVENATVEYDIPLREEAKIPAGESGWWYFNEDGEQDTVVAKYKDGEVTFNFGTGTANWYSRQLFYRDVASNAGQAYKFTFKINASVAGDITINGQVFSLTEGDNEIEVSATGGTGTLISIQFGVMAPGTDGLTQSAIAEGNFKITDFVMAEKVVETSGAIVKNGETDAKPDEWTYWYAEDASWNCGTVVDMLAAKNENGTITLSYQGGSVDYSVQLFYKDSKVVSGTYAITLNIDCNVDSLPIKINGNVITLKKGNNPIEVVCELAQGGTTFSMQCNGNAAVTTLVLSNIKWEQTTREALATPTALTIGEDKTVTVTDTNGDKATGYKLTFTSGDKKYEIQIQNGEKLNDSKLPDGTYDVAVTALGTGKYSDSPISQKLATYTVANGGVKYDLEGSGSEGAVAAPGEWTYWTEFSGITDAKFNGDVITLKIVNGGNWYSNQVFYKNGSLKVGTSYKLTFVLTTTQAGKITINDKPLTLVAGDNNIEVTYTEAISNGCSFSLAFGWQNGGVDIDNSEITIKNVAWEETEDLPPQPTTGFDFGEEVNTKNGWAYWNDQNWAGATVAVSEHTLTPNDDGTFNITMKYNCTAGGTAFGLQIFYNNSMLYKKGDTYKLTFAVTAKTDCTITINGQQVSLVAGQKQNVEVTFVYTYPDGEQYGTSLFDMQATVESGKDYELTLENIKWEAAEPVVAEHPKAEDYTLGEAITPKGTELVKGGAQDIGSNVDKWYYWYVESTDWNCGEVVTVTKAEFANGAFTLTYNGGSVDYAAQLFYKASDIDGAKQYFVTATIETDKAVKVKINGEVYDLTAGTHQLTAVSSQGGDPSLSVQFNAVTEATTVKLSNIQWQEVNPTGVTPGPGTGGETPAGAKEITITGTDFYAPNFVKLSMSAEDLALVGAAANLKVNGQTMSFQENKGFLVDGDKLQVMLPQDHAAGVEYDVIWYDAQGTAIAHCHFVAQA